MTARTWRERVGRPGKFRDAEFLVETAELEGGRRNAVHEFPFREGDPYVEDTGAKGRVFVVECFVAGDDYLEQRDELLAELESGGPGQLVHPHYGTRTVSVDRFTIRETPIAEGRIARFSITFLQTTQVAPQPSATVSGSAAVVSSAAAAKSAAATAFQAAFQATTKIHDGVAQVLNGATAALNGILSTVAFATQDAASLRTQIQNFGAATGELASSPGTLVTTATGLFDSLKDAVLAANNATDPLGVLLGIYGFDAGPAITPPSPTPDRTADTANAGAAQVYLQRLALIEAALIAVDLTFSSYDDAVIARERITDLLDDQADSSADDSYPEFVQLRADLVKALPGDAGDLPHLLRYTPRLTVPSLVLSHRLYGNVDGEADILARNKIQHPGFVPGGVELEVLSA